MADRAKADPGCRFDPNDSIADDGEVPLVGARSTRVTNYDGFRIAATGLEAQDIREGDGVFADTVRHNECGPAESSEAIC